LKILRLIQKDFIIEARQKRTSVFIWHVAKKKNESSKADRPLLLHNKLVKNFRAALRFYVFSTARDRNRYSFLFLYIFLFRGSDLIGFLNIETVGIRRKREMADKILILKIWEISMCCRNGRTEKQESKDYSMLLLYGVNIYIITLLLERSIQITLRMTNIFQAVCPLCKYSGSQRSNLSRNEYSRGNTPVDIRMHKQVGKRRKENRGEETEFCSAFIIFLKLRPRRDSRVSNCQDSSTCCSLITPERRC